MGGTLTLFINELVQNHSVEPDLCGFLLLLFNVILRLEHPSQVLSTVGTRADSPGVAGIPSVGGYPLDSFGEKLDL